MQEDVHHSIFWCVVKESVPDLHLEAATREVPTVMFVDELVTVVDFACGDVAEWNKRNATPKDACESRLPRAQLTTRRLQQPTCQVSVQLGVCATKELNHGEVSIVFPVKIGQIRIVLPEDHDVDSRVAKGEGWDRKFSDLKCRSLLENWALPVALDALPGLHN